MKLQGIVGAALFTVASLSHAAPIGLSVLLRVGPHLYYYDDCIPATNILEPGDPGSSYLVLNSCVMTSSTQTAAPSWVVDNLAAWGGSYLDGAAIGECWLIRHQLIYSNPTMTIECKKDALFNAGFEH